MIRTLSSLNRKPKATLFGVVCLTMVSTLALTQQSFSQDANTTTAAPMIQLPNFRAMIEQNADAVVNIRGTRKGNMFTNRFGQGQPQLDDIPEPFRRFFDQLPQMPDRAPGAAQGSGFIISADGYVLTNAHVVANTEEVFVRLTDRREFKAEVVGADARTDVAVLKIDTEGLPTVNIGDSDALYVGDWVLAIGSPFGFEHSASQGIVSALGRSLPDGTYVPFIQTDVAVNPGNSGGPLFDLQGNVMGINSQIYSRSGGYMGLSFAIPVNLAMNIVDQIKDKGYVSRGWLGVMIQDMTQPLADSFGLDKPQGALVSQITPDSPAAKAGVEVGDVITHFDNNLIDRSADLPPLVGSVAAGSSASLQVLRDGKERTLTVTIGELDEQDKPKQLAFSGSEQNKRLGVAVAQLNAEQRSQLGVDHGVVVNHVEPGSAAAKAGLRSGDVILSFNNERIENVERLVELVKQAPTEKPSVVLLKRDQGMLFVPVDVG